MKGRDPKRMWDNGVYGLKAPKPAPPPEVAPTPVLNYAPEKNNAPSAWKQFLMGAAASWLLMGSLLMGMFTLNDQAFAGLMMLYFLSPVALLTIAGLIQARKEWMSILPGTVFGVATMFLMGCICWMKS